MMRGGVVLGCLLTLSCAHKEPAREAQAPSTPGESKAEGSVGAPALSRRAGDQAGTPASLRQLPVTLQVELTKRGVGLHVLATGSEDVELSETVTLAAAAGDPTTLSPLQLRLDCQHHGCVKLAPGAELIAPPWLGQIEGERCDALVLPPRAGDYRVQVRSCDGTRSAETTFRWADP